MFACVVTCKIQSTCAIAPKKSDSPEIEKERLLRIAAGFERLAEYAERWEVDSQE